MASSCLMASKPTCMLLTLGDELLIGLRDNGHLHYLGEILSDEGIYLLGNLVARDGLEAIKEAVEYCWQKADILIITGGLGPTVDDNTREGVSLALKVPLEKSEHVEAFLKAKFERFNREMPPSTLVQCNVLTGAQVMDNHRGTAPGQILEHENKILIMLPGPPNELRPMIEEVVLKHLRAHYNLISKKEYIQFRTVGAAEAKLAEKLDALTKADPELALAYCAHDSQVDVRLSYKNTSDVPEDIIAHCKDLMGDTCFAQGHVSFPEVVVKELISKNKSLATAESCTGGLLGDTLTNIGGVSSVFKGGIISYQNDIKERQLNVPTEVLENEGPVSEACAKAMAEGVRKNFSADYGLSITGFAGPSGGIEASVGTVFVGLASRQGAKVIKLFYQADRPTIKRRAVINALNLLRKEINQDEQ